MKLNTSYKSLHPFLDTLHRLHTIEALKLKTATSFNQKRYEITLPTTMGWNEKISLTTLAGDMNLQRTTHIRKTSLRNSSITRCASPDWDGDRHLVSQGCSAWRAGAVKWLHLVTNLRKPPTSKGGQLAGFLNFNENELKAPGVCVKAEIFNFIHWVFVSPLRQRFQWLSASACCSQVCLWISLWRFSPSRDRH